MVSTSDLSKTLNSNLANLIQENVSINSTAFESGETRALVGSKTECALIQLTESWTSFSLSDLRHRYPITQVFPFSSERKMMSTLIQLPDTHYKFRLFVKGASEMVLAKSTQVINLNSQELESLEFEGNEKSKTEQTIMEYAGRSLRTIGLAYVDIQLSEKQISMYGSIDPQEQSEFWTNWLYNNKSDDPSDQLVWIGVVGIEDPLREGVVEAVKACERSGVVVRMVTGDNVLTAKAIATQCGILTPGGIVMEGPKFRELSDHEMNKVVPKLQVLARSSPQDKMILVKKLKALGHIVAVTGDGTNDGPALKSADIGFSMGISGTEVAKEASSIVLMDDNFASIVKAIMWGRMVNDSIKKFLQFQLTINFSAILIAFISSVISSKNQSVLSVVQLLWVNLIMDTLAALALATDVPDDDILDRPPDRRDAPLITDTMWKMIGCQGLLQTIMCFALLYGGRNLV
ncbi:HAD-like protein, partial [Conidiobolus coronatus NRRL 28638]